MLCSIPTLPPDHSPLLVAYVNVRLIRFGRRGLLGFSVPEFIVPPTGSPTLTVVLIRSDVPFNRRYGREYDHYYSRQNLAFNESVTDIALTGGIIRT